MVRQGTQARRLRPRESKSGGDGVAGVRSSVRRRATFWGQVVGRQEGCWLVGVL